MANLAFNTEENLLGCLEAILFMEPSGLLLSELSRMIECKEGQTKELLKKLKEKIENEKRSICLQENGSSYRLNFHSRFVPFLMKHYQERKSSPLSSALLETLSLIAYTQPTTRAEIETLRGVSADVSLRKLISHDLIRKTEKRQTAGRPDQYVTTKEFLHRFGLKNLSHLPPLDELDHMRFHAENSEPLMSLFKRTVNQKDE